MLDVLELEEKNRIRTSIGQQVDFSYLLSPAVISKRQRIMPNMKTMIKQPPPRNNKNLALSKPERRKSGYEFSYLKSVNPIVSFSLTKEI